MTLHAHGVWKSFPRWQVQSGTLRSTVVNRTPLLARRAGRRWALEDVGVEVRPGETVGLIGRNGAGKTTFLRLCAGLGRPTLGTIETRGRVAAVLSLGSWFDGELSGRENAETASLVLGASARDARSSVPAILDFAELQEFADAPVRTYSDGMRLRLAFSVVAQLEPDLLVIDETLAVGDIAFQRKCLDRLRELRAQGTALLLASHDLGLVEGECDRAVWLDRGRVRQAGGAAEVVGAYRDAGREETLARTPAPGSDAEIGDRRFGSQEARIEAVRILDPSGAPATELPSGTGLTVELDLVPGAAAVEDPRLVVGLHRVEDDVLCHEASTATGGVRLATLERPATVRLEIDRLDLVPGEYAVTVGLYPPDWAYAYDWRWHVATVVLTGEPGWNGVVRAGHRWRQL